MKKDTTIRTLRNEHSAPCFWCGAPIWWEITIGPPHYIYGAPPVNEAPWEVPFHGVCDADHGEKAANLATFTQLDGCPWVYGSTSFIFAK